MDVVNKDINYTFDVLNGYNNEKYSNVYFKSKNFKKDSNYRD